MNLLQVHGLVSCFVANEVEGKDIAYHTSVAEQLAARHIDTAIVKVHDGEIRWYPDTATLLAIRQAYLAQGVGMIPFGYCYGPKFGDQQIYGEANVIKEICDTYKDEATFYIADMESEWNGDVEAAKTFVKALEQGMHLPLGVSTWADPSMQNWNQVIEVLNTIVSVWLLQRYNNWLAAQPFPGHTQILPTVDLSQEFGANDPVAIAAKTSMVSMWEYVFLPQYPSIVEAIVTQKKHTPLPQPTPPPAPVPDGGTPYTVKRGDTLWSIAVKYGTTAEALYVRNRAAIEQAANAHGFANSNYGSWIFPGEVIYL